MAEAMPSRTRLRGAMLESRERHEPQGLKPLSSAVDSDMAKAMPSHSDRAMSSEADRAMPSRAYAMDRGGEGEDEASTLSVRRWIAQITLWRVIVAVIFVAGAYATYARFALGFAASTNLTDPQPWGLWVGFGTLCGVGLSAGGFGIAAAVYLLGFERYRPVLRTAVLVSFLGYMSVIAGMMYELGLPWRIWHPIFMWNRHSMLFEVSWCVMLYSTVLSLEFSPALVEKIPWKRLRDWYLKQQHRILIGLVVVGCV